MMFRRCFLFSTIKYALSNVFRWSLIRVKAFSNKFTSILRATKTWCIDFKVHLFFPSVVTVLRVFYYYRSSPCLLANIRPCNYRSIKSLCCLISHFRSLRINTFCRVYIIEMNFTCWRVPNSFNSTSFWFHNCFLFLRNIGFK
jgi:hypothetical protein